MPLYSQDQIQTIASKIKDVRFGMFTTCDADQLLTSRPLTTQQIDNEGNLWFFTTDEAAFTLDLPRHPDVNISYSAPERQLYLSIAGQAFLLKDKAKARELWTPEARNWFPKGVDDPHLTLIRVRIQSAEYWDAGSSKMTQLVQMARKALTGRSTIRMDRPTTICL
ncbi:general stress protein [Duganella sp. Leaf126]|uniref:pyridoxamine 5'-phosphate oxidase family protein n=1 Tax=Duganella sp. Leaf126 TaxID=1736266 RepID=UPI0006FEF13B|nr:pyridoxamine 5'-phosphate oxidase family protein [Duganella sp. Leaf126]KQQ33318.1 general stress protein [Duganella sp. Leaf126]